MLAILILSAVLSVALGILYIILIELQINQNARESYKAFYAAETGLECAQFYYRHAHPTLPGPNFWDPKAPCFGADDTDTACYISGSSVVFCNGNRVTNFTTSVPANSCEGEPVGWLRDDCNAAGIVNNPRDYDFDIENPESLKPGIFTHVRIHAVRLKSVDEGLGVKVLIESRGRNKDTEGAVNRTRAYCASANDVKYCPPDQQP